MTVPLRSVQFVRSRVPPNLIPSLKVPKARILWIGCSDSGDAETQTLDLLPEEMVVHRNLGGILSNDDLGTQSSLEYALRLLEVRMFAPSTETF
jgi:carbonic anhydrase